MTIHEFPEWANITAYITGEASPEVRATVQAWAGAKPDHAALLANLEHAWQITRSETSWDVVAAQAAIRERLDRASKDHRSVRPTPASSWRGSRVLAYGALVTVALVFCVGWVMRALRERFSGAPRTYTTAVGQQAIIRLSDGSRVRLAPQTTLSVPRDFNRGTRTLDLVGEARFDVTADTRAPLVVRTGNVTTRVLGTAFDVRRYADDIEGHIQVFDGKVATKGLGASVTLSAGMAGRFTDSVVTALAAGDAQSHTSWSDDELIFRKVPVSTMLATLRHWYGYQFQLADSSLAVEYVTATFPVGNTADMMQRLKRLLDVSMTFKDSVVTLRANRAPAQMVNPERNKMRTPFSSQMELGR